MEINHVEKALVFASYLPEFWLTNEELLKIVEGHPELVPVASIDGGNFKISWCEEASKLKDHLSTGVFKAVKLYTGYWHKDPNHFDYLEVYNACKDAKVPVIFHTGDTLLPSGKLKFSNPLLFDEIAVDNPDLNIVLAHMGTPFIKEAAAVVYKNKNVYGDLACFVAAENLRKYKYLKNVKENLIKAINYVENTEKFLFGSDWPLAPIGDSLTYTSELLDFSPEDWNKMTSENAKKLFKL